MEENAYSPTPLPVPPPPGLYLIFGPSDLVPRMLEVVTRGMACEANVLWVDATNTFDAHRVAVLARSINKNPYEVLRSFRIARPFTAYQLEAMVSEKLLPALRQSKGLFSVITDPLPLYEEARKQDRYWQKSYSRWISSLKELSRESAVLVLISSFCFRKNFYAPLIQNATRLLRLVDSKEGPRLVSFSAFREIPSPNRIAKKGQALSWDAH